MDYNQAEYLCPFGITYMCILMVPNEYKYEYMYMYMYMYDSLKKILE